MQGISGIRDKLFRLKNLAMSQSENLSFRLSYDFDGHAQDSTSKLLR